MPILFDQDGKLNNLRHLLWTTQGSARSAKSVITSYQGVNRTVWELDSPELFLTSNQLGSQPVSLYFTAYRNISIYVSGNGGAGGQSGNKWALNNGGSGGGGGPGGCAQIVTYPYNIDPRSIYVQFSRNRFEGQYIGLSGPLNTGGIDICIYRYGQDKPIATLLVTDGQDGQRGENASVTNLYPDGGLGGAFGSTFYLDSLTSRYVAIGESGERGHDGGWQDNSNNGKAGAPASNISLISVQPDGSLSASMSSGNPIQIAKQGWYVAYRNNRNAFYSTDLNNLCLGNAGAGGHDSVIDGNLSPGTAGQGGVLVKYV